MYRNPSDQITKLFCIKWDWNVGDNGIKEIYWQQTLMANFLQAYIDSKLVYYNLWKVLSALLVSYFIGFQDLVSEQFKDLEKFPQKFVWIGRMR